MIAGTLSDSLEPIVEICLLRANQRTTIPAIVDTGFSGDLCLSRHRLGAMDLDFSYVDRYELADGTVVAKDVFMGKAEFGGRVLDLEIILTDSADTLIGASMMKSYVLTVDYTKGTVRLDFPATSHGTSYI